MCLRLGDEIQNGLNFPHFFLKFFQYAELMKKRKVVLNDKAKIASVIEELDKKKEVALIKAWEQVNKVILE